MVLTGDFEKFCKKSFLEAMCTSSAAFLFFSICKIEMLISNVEVLFGSTTYIHVANAKTFGSIRLGLCF